MGKKKHIFGDYWIEGIADRQWEAYRPASIDGKRNLEDPWVSRGWNTKRQAIKAAQEEYARVTGKTKKPPTANALAAKAKARGKTRFKNPNGPCQEHSGTYYVSTRVCVECDRIRQRTPEALEAARKRYNQRRNEKAWSKRAKAWAKKYGHEYVPLSKAKTMLGD